MKKISSTLVLLSSISVFSPVNAASFDVEITDTFGRGCIFNSGSAVAEVNEINGQATVDFELYSMDVYADVGGLDTKACHITFDLIPHAGTRIMLNQAFYNVSYSVEEGDWGSGSIALRRRGESGSGDGGESGRFNFRSGSGIAQAFTGDSSSPIISGCGERVSVRVATTLFAISYGGTVGLSANGDDLNGNRSIFIPVETGACLK